MSLWDHNNGDCWPDFCQFCHWEDERDAAEADATNDETEDDE